MTGSLRSAERGALADDPHTRAVLSLDNGSDVAYRDVRRFGTWELFEPGDLAPYLDARLGPEPLGALTAAGLGRRGSKDAGRRSSRRSSTSGRSPGSGTSTPTRRSGTARLHPLRIAGGLGREELVRLHRAIRRGPAAGIERQGSTLRDYALPDGAYGSMQHEFRAYGRSGEPCDRCGTPLVRIVVGGRTTTFCPHCQGLSG